METMTMPNRGQLPGRARHLAVEMGVGSEYGMAGCTADRDRQGMSRGIPAFHACGTTGVVPSPFAHLAADRNDTTTAASRIVPWTTEKRTARHLAPRST